MSSDWIVMTTYNTEMATTDLEMNASQYDRDFIVMINWKELEKKLSNSKIKQFRDGIYFYHVKSVLGNVQRELFQKAVQVNLPLMKQVLTIIYVG